MSLEKVAKDVNKNPENADSILAEYLSHHSSASVNQNVELICNQLQRFQRLYASITTDLEEQAELVSFIIAAGNALRQAGSSFQTLLAQLEARNEQ